MVSVLIAGHGNFNSEFILTDQRYVWSAGLLAVKVTRNLSGAVGVLWPTPGGTHEILGLTVVSGCMTGRSALA
jgi:hypothetical protein